VSLAAADHQLETPELPGSPLRVVQASSRAEWDAFVSAHPAATVDHLWGWRDVIDRALGHDGRYLVARRGDAVVGVLPLVLVRSRIFGRSVVSLPFLNYGGILADDGDVAGALVDAAREAAIGFRATHVELRHLSRQCPDLPCRQHKLAMTLPLPGSTDELWASLDRKVRNQVRKAQKANLDVTAGGAELVDAFYGVFARNMRDLGTPVYPKSLFIETLAAFPDQARVFVVRLDRRPIAAGVTIAFRGSVLNPWASSLREFRNLCPNMLLYWAMLEQAVGRGATTFDFGRSSPGGGTHQFKLQWGATERPMCWEYVLLARQELPDQSPSNTKFERAIALWQRLPLAVANLAGPIIARHLP
jgi:serine/alanine adding enzyme